MAKEITEQCPQCGCEFVPPARQRKRKRPPFVVTSETSYQAALAIVATWKSDRKEVLRIIQDSGERGVTTQEIETLLGRVHESVSARVTELKESGMVVCNGQERRNRSGRFASVLVVWPHRPNKVAA